MIGEESKTSALKSTLTQREGRGDKSKREERGWKLER